MKSRTLHITLLLLFAFCVTAYPACWESPVKQAGIISPTPASGFGRILFKFDLPSQLQGVIIDFADLTFFATPDTGSSYICLMGAFPVTRSWEPASLSWSNGWTNAGGDHADSIFSTSVIRTSSERPSRVDITDIVQMWVDGTLANYGLMVMPLGDSNRFLKLHANPAFEPDVKAKVRIFYTLMSGD